MGRLEVAGTLGSPGQLVLDRGNSLFLSVAEASPNTVSTKVRWTLNGETIPGAAGSELHMKNVTEADGGLFQAELEDGNLLYRSEATRVIVSARPLGFSDSYSCGEVLMDPSGNGLGDNSTATRFEGEPEHAGKPGRRSVWISWVAEENGVATFATTGSTFDTLLAVYRELPDRTVEVASDDDGGGYHTSLVQFNAVAGHRYEIVVDGYAGESGVFMLSWALDSTRLPLPEIVAPLRDTSVPQGQAVTLSVVAFGPLPINVQWYFNQQPLPGEFGPELVIEDFQREDVGLYSIRMTMGDPSDFSTGQYAETSATLQINTEGLSAVMARDKPADSFIGRLGMVSMARPQGDAGDSDRQQRASFNLGAGASTAGFSMVQGYTGTQIFDTRGAGKDAGEPDHCGVIGGASYWFT